MLKFFRRILCLSERPEGVTTEQADKIVSRIKGEIGKTARKTEQTAQEVRVIMEQRQEDIAIRIYKAAHPGIS